MIELASQICDSGKVSWALEIRPLNVNYKLSLMQDTTNLEYGVHGKGTEPEEGFCPTGRC